MQPSRILNLRYFATMTKPASVFLFHTAVNNDGNCQHVITQPTLAIVTGRVNDVVPNTRQHARSTGTVLRQRHSTAKDLTLAFADEGPNATMSLSLIISKND